MTVGKISIQTSSRRLVAEIVLRNTPMLFKTYNIVLFAVDVCVLELFQLIGRERGCSI